MSSVDERIVEMRFDNQQFESGVSTSLRSLDRLKSGLSGLGDSADNLSELQTQAGKFDISGISNGVEKLTERFSVFGIMADQAIRLATTGLVNVGARAAGAVKNLTISPIATGFSQYEQETKSVQTLMNATGLGMEEIEKYTEKLGFYVDETSYSYESMFSTLASMMSSGVEDIDMGVDALVGLGNAAGLAGVDAEQATHAFQGFGKAIGQGYMDTRNWSWIKTARMDTTALKQAFIDAGVSAGTLVQQVDPKTGDTLTYIADSAGKANTKLGEINAANMDNFLSEKWLNRDVMLAGVGNYSDAFNEIFAEYQRTGEDADTIIRRMGGDLDEYSLKAFKAANQTRTFTDVVEYISGAAARRWSNAFKSLFGNFEEATALWSSLINPLYSIFIDPLDSMNDLLSEWRDLGGYQDVADGITEIFEGAANAVSAFREAFSDIFPPMTAERLLEITTGFKNLADRFTDFTSAITDEDDNIVGFTNETFGNLITGFKGALSVVSLLGKGFKTFFSSLSPTTALIKQFGQKAIESFGKLGEFLINLNNSQKVADLFSSASEKLVNIQTKLANVITNINSRFATFASAIKGDVIDGFKGIGSAISLAWKGLKAFAEAASPITNVIKNIGTALVDAFFSLGIDFASMFGKLGRFITELDKCTSATEIFNVVNEKASEIANKVTGKFANFGNTIKTVYENIKKFTKENIGKGFKDLLSGFNLKGITTLIAGIGAALTGVNIWRLLDHISWTVQSFLKSGKSISDTLGTITDAFWAMGQSISAGTILKVAIAIGLLAGALLLLGNIKTESLSQGLMAITVLFAELYGIMALFTKKDIFATFSKGGTSAMKAATSMVLMAVSVGILAGAIKKISNIDPESLAKGLLGIGVLMAALVGASILLSKYSGSVTTGAAGMIAMSVAVILLSFAVKSLSSISSGFDQGLVGTIVLLGALAGVGIALSQFSGKFISAAIGLIGLSAAMAILSGVVKSLGGMDTGSLVKGTIAAIALIGALTAFEAISKGAGGISQGLGMIGIAAGLKIIVSSVQELASMDPDALVQGLASVGALLGGIGVLMSYLGTVQGKMGSAASILIVAASLAILSSVISSIGSLSEGAALQGVAGIGAVLLEIAIALSYMKGTIGAAAALVVAAASILILTGAIAALSAIDPLSMVTALLGLAAALAIIGVAGYVLGPIAPLILAVAGSLAVFGLAVVLAGAGMMLLGAGMTSLAAGMTAGAASIVASLSTLIAGIGIIGASLAASVAILIAGIAGGIASAAVAIAGAVLALVMGILQVLAASAPAIATAAIQLITGLLNAVASQIGPLAMAGVALIVSFINGIAVALDSNGPMLISAIMNLGKAMFNTFIEVFAELLSLIPGIGSSLADGLSSLKFDLDAAVAQTDLSSGGEAAASSVAEGVDSAAPTVEASGQNLGNSLTEGITSGLSGTEGLGSDISSSLTSGLEGISPEMFSSGEGAGMEFISGLLETNPQVQDAGTQLGNSGSDGVDSTEGSWTASGGFVASGFISGILSKLADAKSAGAQLSTSAQEGADAAVDIASPSKTAMRSGAFFGEGWIIGISSMLRKATHVGEDLGNAPMNGVSSAVSNLSQLIEDGMDTNPTITPVLDLSEIRSGMGELSSLTDYSMNLGAPSLSMPEQQPQAITQLQIREFLSLGNAILKEIQNGSDLYFDDGAFAGRINRRLGSL